MRCKPARKSLSDAAGGHVWRRVRSGVITSGCHLDSGPGHIEKMARAMHQVRNVVAAVDIRGLQPGQATDIHTCCHKILQLCERYSTTPTSCGFNFFDSTLRPGASKMKDEEALGNLASYSRFSSPDQMYDPFAFALDECCSDPEISGSAEDSVNAGSAMGFLRESLVGMLDQFPWHAKAIEQDREKKTWETEPNLLVLFTPWLHLSSVSLNMSKAELVKSLVRELKGVANILSNRGVHLCWVNVERFSGLSSNESQTKMVDDDRFSELASEQLEIRSRFAQRKWSFWDLEFLISSSASVPFTLIWPLLAFSALRLPCRETFTSADVLLEVETSGMTTVEAISHVELYDLTFLQPGSKPSSRRKCCISGDGPKRVPGEAAATVMVTKVLPKHEARPDWLIDCDTFLMWTCSKTQCVKNGRDYHLQDSHVLKLLQQDRCEFDLSKPSFQLFLLQLARARAAAVVHFSSYGSSYAALLEPLTIHCATLSIITSKEHSLLAIISSSPKLRRLSSQHGQAHIVLEQLTCELEGAAGLDPNGGRKLAKQEQVAMEAGTGNSLTTMYPEVASPSAIGEASTADQSASVVDAANGWKRKEQEEQTELRNDTEDPLTLEEAANPSMMREAMMEDIGMDSVDECKGTEGHVGQGGMRDETENPLFTGEVTNPLTIEARTEHQQMSMVEGANNAAECGIPQPEYASRNSESTEIKDVQSMVHEGDESASAEPNLGVLYRELSPPVLAAVEQQTRHLDMHAVQTEMRVAEQSFTSGQTQRLRSITSPNTTLQTTESLSNPEVTDLNAAGNSEESSTRLEMAIMTQLQSLVSQGIFSEQEIVRLAVEICRLMEILFLPSRRGVPRIRQERLQVFFQRYLDPFPVIFEKVCEMLEDKGWVMTRLNRRSVRNRIRRQELQGHRTRETYVQIRRKQTNIDGTVDDTEVTDDLETSSVVSGKKQRGL